MVAARRAPARRQNSQSPRWSCFRHFTGTHALSAAKLTFSSAKIRVKTDDCELSPGPSQPAKSPVALVGGTLAWWCSGPSSKRRAVRCAASPLSTKKVRNPPIRGRFLTFVPPTHPLVEVALQQGGCLVFGTALLRQRSWLSHLRAKVLSQEPTAKAALIGAQHGTRPATRGLRGGHQWR